MCEEDVQLTCWEGHEFVPFWGQVGVCAGPEDAFVENVVGIVFTVRMFAYILGVGFDHFHPQWCHEVRIALA